MPVPPNRLTELRGLFTGDEDAALAGGISETAGLISLIVGALREGRDSGVAVCCDLALEDTRGLDDERPD